MNRGLRGRQGLHRREVEILEQVGGDRLFKAPRGWLHKADRFEPI